MYLYSIALATVLVGTSQHFGLSSNVSTIDPPYEDDPKNFEHQHATGFLCSNSTYYMLNRTYTPQPPSECVSVNVTSGLRNGTYQALLRHRFNGSSEISSLNITVHPFTSEPHTEDNALLFNISMKPNVNVEAGTATAGVGPSEHDESGFPAPQPPLYKFLYINSNKTCAVLRATHQQNGTGCELFSAGPPPFVPQDCKDVYLNISNCPNTTSEVWKEDCKYKS
uniref:Putative 22.7 kDa secreted protein n=1 Tax=Ixodes scapularis TaxID=6945 RepID=Q8MV97_IXOSC|nr:putative 22.7 kDa secreted protein [Ixodes scapularis]